MARGNIDYDQIQEAVRQGDGEKFQMFGGGTATEGNVLVYDDAGNAIDGGAAGSGTVTHTAGALTLDLPVLGNGAADVKIGTAIQLVPATPSDATKFLNGAATPAFALVKDSDLSTSDITTNNVSTTKHGFAPKVPNDATKFLDGTGAYSVPPGTGVGTVTHTAGALTADLPVLGNGAADVKIGTAIQLVPATPSDATKFLNGAATPAFALVKDSDLSTSDITTNDVSTSKHGFTPKAPNDATKFLDGTGAWAVPAGGGSGALTQIAQQVLGSSSASVTFSAISGSYTNLVLKITARGTQATAFVSFRLTFNGDSGANYEWCQHYVSGGTAGASQATSQNYIGLGNMPGSNQTANAPGQLTIQVHRYSGTTFLKTLQAQIFYLTAATMQAFNSAGGWNSTSAITSITIVPDAGSFATGSTFTLYGEQ
jgi:hypothetical protein